MESWLGILFVVMAFGPLAIMGALWIVALVLWLAPAIGEGAQGHEHRLQALAAAVIDHLESELGARATEELHTALPGAGQHVRGEGIGHVEATVAQRAQEHALARLEAFQHEAAIPVRAGRAPGDQRLGRHARRTRLLGWQVRRSQRERAHAQPAQAEVVHVDQLATHLERRRQLDGPRPPAVVGGEDHLRPGRRASRRDGQQQRAPGGQRDALEPARLVAFPNPFNPHTTIRFALAHASHLRLTLHDTSGRELLELASAPYSAGEHELQFEAQDRAGRPLASGVYLLRLESALGRQERIKLVLLR